MKKYFELIKVLSANLPSKVELLNQDKKKNKYSLIFRKVADGKLKTNEEIASELNIEAESAHFRVFKSRFKDKLLENLLFAKVKEKKQSPYTKASDLCGKNIYCIRLLFSLGARKSAITLANHTLQTAINFQLSDAAIFCSKNLRYHYSIIGDKKKANHFNSIYHEYFKKMSAEDLAIEYSDRIYLEYGQTHEPRPELAEDAKRYAAELRPLVEKHNTYILNVYYYRILGTAYYIELDFKKSLKVWQEFESFLENYKHYEYDTRLGEALFQQLGCYLHSGEFEKGRECAEKCRKLFAQGTHTWFFFMEYYFLLAMHTSHYEDALKIYSEVTGHARFPFLIDIRKEKWLIMEAYLSFLYRSGSIPGAVDVPESIQKFKIGKFINETPTYSKDKRGYNVAIIIAQILHLLHEGRFEQLLDKADALRRYSHRYLKKDSTYRSNLFINMVATAGQAGFDPEQTHQKTVTMLKQLKAARMVYTGDLDSMEIIPFEAMWDKIMEYLLSETEKNKQ